MESQKDMFFKLSQGTNKFRFFDVIEYFDLIVKIEGEAGDEYYIDRDFELKNLAERNMKLISTLPPITETDKKTKQKIERKVTPLDIIKLKRTFLTYQYETQKFGFLSLHQKIIIESLANYYDNPDYVSPEAEKSEYKGLDSFDFTITKKGEGLGTNYSCIASPPKPFAEPAKDLVYPKNRLIYNLSNMLKKDETGRFCYPSDFFPLNCK